jgi:membrane protease YdiL (CAAX protease family)
MASGPQPALDASAPRIDQPSRKLRIIELAFVVFFSTFSPYLSTVYIVLYGSARANTGGNYRLVHLLCYELCALALVGYILFRRNASWRSIGFDIRETDFFHGIGLFVAAWVLSLLVGSVYSSSYRFWFGAAPQFKNVSQMFPIHLSTLWVTFVIVNGFYEEGIVRAFVMTDITSLTQLKWFAVIFSVALQAGYHLYQGPSNVVMIVPVFLVFAVYFARTGRAFPIIFAHIIQDLLILVWHR